MMFRCSHAWSAPMDTKGMSFFVTAMLPACSSFQVSGWLVLRRSCMSVMYLGRSRLYLIRSNAKIFCLQMKVKVSVTGCCDKEQVLLPLDVGSSSLPWTLRSWISVSPILVKLSWHQQWSMPQVAYRCTKLFNIHQRTRQTWLYASCLVFLNDQFVLWNW